MLVLPVNSVYVVTAHIAKWFLAERQIACLSVCLSGVADYIAVMSVCDAAVSLVAMAIDRTLPAPVPVPVHVSPSLTHYQCGGNAIDEQTAHYEARVFFFFFTLISTAAVPSPLESSSYRIDCCVLCSPEPLIQLKAGGRSVNNRCCDCFTASQMIN